MIDFEGTRIKGWNGPTKEDLEKLKPITIENQFDRYNRPNWDWPDYPEGKPIYSPLPYTPEQLEELRNNWIKTEIEKLYPGDIQHKINTEAMDSMLSGQGGTKAFAQMNLDRKRIKEESKTVDFNIKDK